MKAQKVNGPRSARLWVRAFIAYACVLLEGISEGIIRLMHNGKTADGNKAGEVWAIALSEDGQYLASMTFDGRINVWDNLAAGRKIREYETKGSFGMAVDLVGYYTVLLRSNVLQG